MITDFSNFNNVKKHFNLINFCKKHVEYQNHGKYIYICCPFHDDKNPSMEVHETYAVCRAGCKNRNTQNFDAVNLVAEILSLNTKDSMVYIKNEAGVVDVKPVVEQIIEAPQFEKQKGLNIWSVARQGLDDAYAYLFDVRGIPRPEKLPTNLGYIKKDQLRHHKQIPSHFYEECLVAPAYDKNLKMTGLYCRLIHKEGGERHRNFGTCKLWLPEIDGSIIVPNSDTWYAEGITDTFLTMKLDDNYNVAACFSCSNFPKHSNIIVDSDASSVEAAIGANALQIRIGDGVDHAESAKFTDITTINFDVGKMVIAILMYDNNIYNIIRVLPYIFVIANNSYLNYCTAFALRSLHNLTTSDIISTMYMMWGSTLRAKKSKDNLNFFDNMENPSEITLTIFALEAELQNLYKFFSEHNDDSLNKIETFCHAEKLSCIYNKKLLVSNSISLKVNHNQLNDSARECLNAGGLEYLTRGDVHVIAGNTGRGKTTIALKAARNLIKHHPNDKITYISFELTRSELKTKITGYDNWEESLHTITLIDFDLTQKMKHYVHFILNRLASEDYNIIFIDHIGFLADSDGKWLEIIMQQIKTVCNARGITIICLAQLVKGVDSKGYVTTMDQIIGGGWITTIPSSIYLIHEWEKINGKFVRCWKITQAKCRAKRPNDPMPVEINVIDFLKN